MKERTRDPTDKPIIDAENRDQVSLILFPVPSGDRILVRQLPRRRERRLANDKHALEGAQFHKAPRRTPMVEFLEIFPVVARSDKRGNDDRTRHHSSDKLLHPSETISVKISGYCFTKNVGVAFS